MRTGSAEVRVQAGDGVGRRVVTLRLVLVLTKITKCATQQCRTVG